MHACMDGGGGDKGCSCASMVVVVVEVAFARIGKLLAFCFLSPFLSFLSPP